MRTGLIATLTILTTLACGSPSRPPGSAISISIEPTTASLAVNTTQRFTATVTGTSDQSVIWTVVEGAQGGAITADGAYTAPAAPGMFHVIATSTVDTVRSASATVTVTEAHGINVSIEPDHLSFDVGTIPSYQFMARVTGTSDAGVRWSILEGDAGGSIDATGFYTPPQNRGLFHITATSHADPSQTASAIVAISVDLIDHGGPVISTTRTFALWWGDTAAFASDARPSIERLLGGLDGSTYLNIANQYLRGARVTTSFGGTLFDASPPPVNDPPKSVIVLEACQALLQHGISPRTGDLVFVYTSNFPEFPNNVPKYCGWHGWGACLDQTLLVAYIPDVTNTLCAAVTDICKTGYSLSTVAFITTSAHELMESITDPFATGWYLDYFIEVTDACGGSSCVSLPAGKFNLPAQHSNAIHDCVDH
jgi:hypothetical protein